MIQQEVTMKLYIVISKEYYEAALSISEDNDYQLYLKDHQVRVL